MSSVGTELLNEIERVSRKHERWLGMMRETPSMKQALTLGAAVMKAQIAEGKEALQSDDPARAIQALKALQDYSDDD